MQNEISEKTFGNSALVMIKDNIMIIFFIVLALFLAVASGDTLDTIGGDVSARFFRSLLLIVALILPIMAGIGLNFGIVLGAMSAQIAIVILMALGLANSSLSIVFWALLTIIIAGFNGFLLALLFNKTKGQEMIAGLLVGFFANGLYMLLLMVFLGGLIKLDNPLLVVSAGEPIKSTINMSDALYGCLDYVFRIPYLTVGIVSILVIILILIAMMIKKIVTGENKSKLIISTLVKVAALAALLALFAFNEDVNYMLTITYLPGLACLICVIIMLFVWRLMQTKHGHDFISVRNDINISASVGINVDRTRMSATILSTIIAGLGQIIYIQNLGALNTYTMHSNIATYAIAAILIGGATVKSASIKNVLIGNILFQVIYGCAPNAAKMLMGNVQIGEYFRLFLCYGIITVAIVSYAIKELNAAKRISSGNA